MSGLPNDKAEGSGVGLADSGSDPSDHHGSTPSTVKTINDDNAEVAHGVAYAIQKGPVKGMA